MLPTILPSHCDMIQMLYRPSTTWASWLHAATLPGAASPQVACRAQRGISAASNEGDSRRHPRVSSRRRRDLGEAAYVREPRDLWAHQPGNAKYIATLPGRTLITTRPVGATPASPAAPSTPIALQKTRRHLPDATSTGRLLLPQRAMSPGSSGSRPFNRCHSSQDTTLTSGRGSSGSMAMNSRECPSGSRK